MYAVHAPLSSRHSTAPFLPSLRLRPFLADPSPRHVLHPEYTAWWHGAMSQARQQSTWRHLPFCLCAQPRVCPVAPEASTLPLGSPWLLCPALHHLRRLFHPGFHPAQWVPWFASGHCVLISIHPSHGAQRKGDSQVIWLLLPPLSEIGFHGNWGELLGWGGRVLRAHW